MKRGIAGSAVVPLSFVIACNALVGFPEKTIDDEADGSSSGRPESSSSSTSGSASSGNTSSGSTSSTSASSSSGSEAGVQPPPACNGAVDCERLIFVTKATFDGKLGGTAGADEKCFQAAKAIPGYGGRSFRAWLSDSLSAVASRLPRGTRAYRRTDGGIVATSWTDLTDGTLNLAPLDEAGALITGLTRAVWTATDTTGKYNGKSCNDWNTNAVTLTGNLGESGVTTADWTQDQPASEPINESSCNGTRHLYCVEY